MGTFAKWLGVFIFFFSGVCANVQKGISIFTDTKGDHPAVRQSLLRGLGKLNIPYTINDYSHCYQAGIVLAGISYLQRAIALKKEKKIKFLLAGPNLMVRANEYQKILAHPLIDACIVPSDWVAVAYQQDVPQLQNRLYPWFAGIDPEYWAPQTEKKTHTILIYWKTESQEFIRTIEVLVKKHGYVPHCIRYGSYKSEYYKKMLSESVAAIFVSRSESQGLALAEAWAMDVPTLVWNPKELVAHGRTYSLVSACPYLQDAVGKEWQRLQDLEHILLHYDKELFAPRKWVLNNMTDTHSAQKLMDIVSLLQQKE